MPRTSPTQIVLSHAEQVELEALARRYTAPYQEVVRAKIILLAHAGYNNQEIAERLGIARQIACKWRQRFYEERCAGLLDQARSGRPPTFSPTAYRADQSFGVRVTDPARLAAGAFFYQ
ncbi:MAG TPA: helix-turn-helix domain-containing protein [Blastocatellia bacterium]|nr:helix-turn-helix domain-containing protein [Blastocatellia bacterium]